MQFPDQFVWGAATAAYQIEGAHNANGKGPSVWDMMSRWPGRIWQGQRGDIACNHYHRHAEDVALMKQIGLQAYRFSISWPRVLPAGVGKVNPKGLEFYDRLVDELLNADIDPWVTLFHWDFPLALFYRGGWLNRDSVEWFAEYTQVIADRLSDRVVNWITLNEPQCFLVFGHGNGVHAPGLKLPLREQMLACHHILLAHGRAVQVFRDRCSKPPQVGVAVAGEVSHPVDDQPAGIEQARKRSFTYEAVDLFKIPWYLDSLCFGAYPEDAMRQLADDAPRPEPGDMDLMCQKLDFLGVNLYQSTPVAARASSQQTKVQLDDGFPMTFFHWPVIPESLYWGPRFVHDRYHLPIVITENGMSNADWITLDNKVHDPQRIDFTRRYLLQLERAMSDGVDIRGYFHWSVMDNFEWAEGFRQRFGLIYVDFPTGERTLKDSAFWYEKVIRTNGACLSTSSEPAIRV